MPPLEHNTAKSSTTTLSVVQNTGLPVYASRKTNRLVAAVHLVTGSIPEAEPLRQSVRVCSLRFFSEVSRLCSGSTSSDAGIRGIASCAIEMDGLLEVLAHTGYVAVENVDLLRAEYRNLVTLLDEKRDIVVAGSAGIPKELLETGIEKDSFDISDTARAIKDTNKGQHKGHSSQKRQQQVEKAPSGDRLVSRGNRAEAILTVVRANGSVSVRDVAETVTDCSEKTLQRELLRMVSEGILVKEGERRWSTYRLA